MTQTVQAPPGFKGSLILMVAPPGAGKSTLVARWFPPVVRFSLDQFRRLLTGDVLTQSCSGAADLMLQVVIDYRLHTKRVTVIDATNATPERREALRRKASERGRPCVAVVLHTPLQVCIARQKTRTTAPYTDANNRPVPVPVVENMYRRIHDSPPAAADYDLVLHVHPDGPATVCGLSRHGQQWAREFLDAHQGWLAFPDITLIDSVRELPWTTGPGYNRG